MEETPEEAAEPPAVLVVEEGKISKERKLIRFLFFSVGCIIPSFTPPTCLKWLQLSQISISHITCIAH